MPDAPRRDHLSGVGSPAASPARPLVRQPVGPLAASLVPGSRVLALALVASLSVSSRAQTAGGRAAPPADSEVEVVETNLTTLLLTATDRKGRLVNTLRAEDVRVFEDGAEQHVTTFERQTERPLSLALVFDTSGSQWRTLPDQKRAARLFLKSIFRPDRDRAAVISFAGGALVRQPLTSDLTQLERAVDEINLPDAAQLKKTREGQSPAPAQYFGTAIYDTLFLSCYKVLMRSPPDTRRAVILLTDGQDNRSRLTPGQAVAGAVYANAVVYGIGIGYSVNADALGAVTEDTAGRAFFPADSGELRAAFARIEQELRSQYLIAYTPTNKARDGKRRELRVEIVSPQAAKDGVRLAYRSYYYVRKSPAKAGQPR